MISLHLTKKVPPKYKQNYGGGVCLDQEGRLVFGWRDKHTTVNPLGQATAHAILLMQRYREVSVKLTVDKEFTDEDKQITILITNQL